ncbi:MAG TPA: SMP-30/gluconolactonase/LRE family protein [Vicinamibacterales bacterium]|nr:SMP-30/gluconolactonase/LRE family protein [Vicinamibacterales bacterium]
MRFRTFVVAAICALSGAAGGQGRGGAPQLPAADTVAPDIPGVVAGGTKVQLLKEGLDGTEGPIALPDGSVIFSEINTNRTIKIDKDDTFSTFLENTGGTTGVAFDRQGRLFAAVVPWGRTKFSIIYPEAAKRVVIDNYDGKPFGRPNDLAIARNGGIYFTDSANAQPRPAEPLPLPAAFYYLPPGSAKAAQILTDVAFPNGVILSRDEKVLYLNNSGGEYLLAFDVQADGTLTNRRNFAKYEGVRTNANGSVSSGADGLAIDGRGRVYVAASNGVQIFTPQGQHLGTIPTPRPPQNLAFAGPDKKTLYIVGRGVVSKVRMIAEGFKDRAK